MGALSGSPTGGNQRVAPDVEPVVTGRGAPRRDAFEALVAEIYEPLQRYLRRRTGAPDADDVFVEVLTVIWRRLDEVPAGRELPWSYGVARRCLANHQRGDGRRRRLHRRVRSETGLRTVADWTSAADVALHQALDRLPDLDREVVRLWAWEGLEPREIAEALGTTANAVSVRLHRARHRLAEDIDRQDRAPAGHEGVMSREGRDR